ncbi:MAG: hypothetical protein Q9178_007183 [Gyalolechia marmorata]
MKRLDKVDHVKLATTKTRANMAAKFRRPWTETRASEAGVLAQVNEALQASRIVSLCEVNIGSARILPSGDWRFGTAIPKWTELLRIHHGERVKTVRPVARIAIPTYGVIVDRIRVSSVNQEDWSEVIGQIRLQNMGVLTSERSIGSLHWLTKPKRQFCSLVIEFTEAAACNAMVGARELFWCNELRKSVAAGPTWKTKPGGITKTPAPKNKTKSSKTSVAQAMKFLQVRDIAAALGQNKENEARDVEMKEDDEDEAGSFQLSRPSEASGGPVIRRKSRSATATNHEDHE